MKICADDVLVGVAASGTTPYVLAAVRLAKNVGAATIGLAANPFTLLAEITDLAVVPKTGEEALTGSTRLKAGTAQKMVLNMLSTAAMVRLGKTYSNLMVDFVPQNDKLLARAVRIVSMETNVDGETAAAALSAAGDVKTAILTLDSGLPTEECQSALRECGGVLREAIALLSRQNSTC